MKTAGRSKPMEVALLDRLNTLRPPAPAVRSRPPGVFAFVKALWNNPIEAWTCQHFEQRIVLHNFAVGRIAVVSDPPSVRRVLNENAQNYCKDFFQRRMLKALAGGILTAEGEQWASQRSMLAPIFTPRTVRTFVPAMQAAVGAMIERWHGLGDGAVVDVASEVTALALDVLKRTMFADGFGYDTDQIQDAMRGFFDGTGRVGLLDFLGLPAFLPRFGRAGVRPALRLLNEAIDAMIAQRRLQLAAAPQATAYDILTLLLNAQDPETGRGISEEQIRANVLTFMTAGHESTANAIAWTLYLLSQSAEWCERVRAEVDREWDAFIDGSLAGLVETRAVVDESLRLYPPLAAISRAALAPDKFAGHSIDAGTLVVIAPYVLHRHRSLWERPNHFDPTRFLPGRREKIDRYCYLPFGAGRRGCIGAVFAVQETMLAVSSIMRHFDLTMVEGHDVLPVHRITLRPQGGLPMVIRARLQAAKTKGTRRQPAGRPLAKV